MAHLKRNLKANRKGKHKKFRILKIKGSVSVFPFSARMTERSLGGLWQGKQPRNFLISLSLLSLI